jgi:hypothetical protein
MTHNPKKKHNSRSCKWKAEEKEKKL